jgi:hypothetical protein
MNLALEHEVATSAKTDDVWKNTYELVKNKQGWRIVSTSVIYVK